MPITLNLSVLCLTFILAAAPLFASLPDEIAVVPRPEQVVLGRGAFSVDAKTTIVYYAANKEMRPSVEQFAARLRSATGYALPIRDARKMPATNYIFFNYLREEELGREGYRLEIDTAKIEINAHGDPGFFYGMQTLLQLLPPQVFSPTPVKNIRWHIPVLSMMDRPRFSWRGMHLDVSRHFFPKEFIYTYIDMLALHKMNTFHWHLTDDQGWRIEIKKYPRLTGVGAWRADRENLPWDARPPQREGEKATYGGFYTQEEVQAIIRYAADRYITVVPEIEMPAHATAALAAYPEYSCTGGPFTVVPGGVWPITDIYCAGKEGTFEFLQNILDEVMELFPSPYIHVGGDEAAKDNWKKCAHCQARIKNEKLANVGELQSYFIKRIEKFIVSKHRRLIGWDEILEGGLPPGAVVMSWRGIEGGIAAARQGHDVVMTPGTHCYFDYYQGRQDLEPLAIGGFTTLSKVYSYEPVPDSLTASQATHVLGAQANLWSEYLPTPQQAQYMAMPRMAAMAEVLWSPKSVRSWDSFSRRVEMQMRRYDALGYRYARSAYQVSTVVEPDSALHGVRVGLSAEMSNAEIRYTFDGSDPGPTSALYAAPVTMSATGTLRAAAFRDGTPLAGISSQSVVVHKGSFRAVRTSTAPDARYPGKSALCLTDGLLGSMLYNDGSWQGYLGTDFEGVLDLGKVQPLKKISAEFLQQTRSEIHFPKAVEYFVSADGVSYVSAGRTERIVEPASTGPDLRSFLSELPGVSARYVKVRASNVGTIPTGFSGAGDKAWLFIDEIMVE